MRNSEALPKEGDEQVEELCVVCCSKVQLNQCVNKNKDHLLSTNLRVIFLLRNLLQVPDSQLEENLRDCGDPVDWVRLCEQCSKLTRQAEKLHWTIVKTNEQLRSVQQLIVEKSKLQSPSVSQSADKKQRNGQGRWKREKIWRRTRAFLSTHEYDSPVINEFIQGDKLANHLLKWKPTSLEDGGDDEDEHVIKVEVDHLEEENDDVGSLEDADWEPPEAVAKNVEVPRPKSNTIAVIRRKRVNKYAKCICHLCGKIYDQATLLRKHLVRMHQEDGQAKELMEKGFRIWRCEVPGCPARYVRKENLEEHVDKVHQDNYGDKIKHSFFCAFCAKGFYAEKTLKMHEQLFHEGDEKNFKCEFCGFETIAQSYLDGHVRRVHKPSKKFGGQVKGESVVICNICGMQFPEKDADKLEKHKIIHDKEAEQPHPCDICGRAYSTHESMWKHKRKIHKIYRRPEDSRIKK